MAGRTAGVNHIPTPVSVLAMLPSFQSKMNSLDKNWKGKGAVPWREVLNAAGESVPAIGLPESDPRN